MERKQAIALTIMAAWVLFNWQSGAILYFNEDLIIEDILKRSRLDPSDLVSIEEETLEELNAHLESYMMGKAIVGLLNTILLIYLAGVYLDLYRATRSQFTLGLLFLSGALLLYTLFTNPATLIFTSDTGSIRVLRFFNFVPDLFTTIASTILIYLSKQ
jgi:hypothetical protein